MTGTNEPTDEELARRLADLPKAIEPPEDWWPQVRARLARRAAGRPPLTVVEGSAAPARVPAAARGARPRIAARRLVRLAAAVALLTASAAVLWKVRRDEATWRVARLDGAPLLGRDLVAQRRLFPPGDRLLTDDTSRALVEVGRIGHVEVDRGTRVRLLSARASEHRLALEHGTIHARITAPPRLFIVETPAAVAVDLGCAYTLEVDDGGASIIHVTLGWVALEHAGQESLVPAGMRAVAQPGRRLGTPWADDAPDSLRRALQAFDAGAGRDALAAVLATARARDAITLWHLLRRTDGADRERVYDRLAELVPPPSGLTREQVLRLDRAALRLYWERLPLSLPITPEWIRTLWRWWLRLTS